MTPLDIILVGGAGFLLGQAIARRAFHRHVDGPIFRNEVRRQLDVAFRAGVMTAADMTTMMGQEEVAGRLRMVAHEMQQSNENR